jgi:hypothetical protein
MKLDEFVQLLKARPAPNNKQIENLEKVKEISKKFHKEAGIDESPCDFELDESAIVLESGHQPNFIPHLGILKKAFLVDFFSNRLKRFGRKSIPIFELSDYNICTSDLMYQTKIPQLNTRGYEKIGFKISNYKWKRMDALERIPETEWQSILKNIERVYANYKESGVEGFDTNLKDFIELMNESYGRAKNFADINSFLISRICNDILGLKLIFFRLSDAQRASIFLDEGEKIISNFISPKMNRNLIQKDYPRNLIPFRYQCECGASFEIYLSGESNFSGACNFCGKQLHFELKSFPDIFPYVSPDAIGRNLIYFEGLGTALFISGTGGSLDYGVTSNKISRSIGFNIPLTFAWRSKEIYLGAGHITALYSLMKIFKLKIEDFLDPGNLSGKIESSLLESKGTKKEISLKNQLKSSLSVFQNNYSMLDPFTLLGLNRHVLDAWKLDESELKESDGFYILEKNVIYRKPTKWVNLNEEQIAMIYNNLNQVGDKFLKYNEG